MEGLLFSGLKFVCVFFTPVEVRIKTEADVLAEDRGPPHPAAQRPSQDAQATATSFSEATCASQKGFKKTNPKRRKGHHNYHTLFEPRTHHPYLLEMVSALALRQPACPARTRSSVRGGRDSEVSRGGRSSTSPPCVLILRLHLAYSHGQRIWDN